MVKNLCEYLTFRNFLYCSENYSHQMESLLLLLHQFLLYEHNQNQTVLHLSYILSPYHLKGWVYGIVYQLYNIYESRSYACLPIMCVLVLPHHNYSLIVWNCMLTDRKEAVIRIPYLLTITYTCPYIWVSLSVGREGNKMSHEFLSTWSQLFWSYYM